MIVLRWICKLVGVGIYNGRGDDVSNAILFTYTRSVMVREKETYEYTKLHKRNTTSTETTNYVKFAKLQEKQN